MAMNVGRSLSRSQAQSASVVAKLGSGFRIERASDAAAGVSISEGMRSELAQLDQNVRNAETANDLLQVTQAPLRESSQILLRMREMAVAAANGHLVDSQRQILDAEFNQSRAGIDRLVVATRYNNAALLAGQIAVDDQTSTAVADRFDTGVTKVDLSGAAKGTYTFSDSGQDSKLTLGNGVVSQTLDLSTPLDNGRVATGTKLIANFDRLGVRVTLSGASTPSQGDYVSGDLAGKSLVVEKGQSRHFQIAPSNQPDKQLSFELPDMRASGDTLDLDSITISTQLSARESLAKIDFAIEQLSRQRGEIGALQNRLAHSIDFSENEIENIRSSESVLRDSDVALETSKLSKSQMLSAVGTAMLTQSFISSGRALQLLVN
jgi:flagellin